MGVCQSDKKSRNSSSRPSINQRIESNNKKMPNPHSIIKNQNSQKITKQINDLKGDMVCIDNCNDSKIFIMDYTSQVIIEQCNNCIFFIAPCKTSINLRNSKNILLICASQQFRCTNVQNCKISLFTNSKPAIETAKNLSLACFCFNYTKLDEMFTNASLNIWNNQWSEYELFSKDCEVNYFNVRDDIDFIDRYTTLFKDQEVDIFQYNPIIYTAGLSHEIYEESEDLVLFFKDGVIEKYSQEIDEIGQNAVLIRTRPISYKEATYLLGTDSYKHGYWKPNFEYIMMWFSVGNLDLVDKLKEYLIGTFEQDIYYVSKSEMGDLNQKVKKFLDYK